MKSILYQIKLHISNRERILENIFDYLIIFLLNFLVSFLLFPFHYLILIPILIFNIIGGMLLLKASKVVKNKVIGIILLSCSILWALFGPLIILDSPLYIYTPRIALYQSKFIPISRENKISIGLVQLTDPLRPYIYKYLRSIFGTNITFLRNYRLNDNIYIDIPVEWKFEHIQPNPNSYLPGRQVLSLLIPMISYSYGYNVESDQVFLSNNPKINFTFGICSNSLVETHYDYDKSTVKWEAVCIANETNEDVLKYICFISEGIKNVSFGRSEDAINNLLLGLQYAPNHLEKARACVLLSNITMNINRGNVGLIQMVPFLHVAFNNLNAYTSNLITKKNTPILNWIHENLSRNYSRFDVFKAFSDSLSHYSFNPIKSSKQTVNILSNIQKFNRHDFEGFFSNNFGADNNQGTNYFNTKIKYYNNCTPNEIDSILAKCAKSERLLLYELLGIDYKSLYRLINKSILQSNQLEKEVDSLITFCEDEINVCDEMLENVCKLPKKYQDVYTSKLVHMNLCLNFYLNLFGNKLKNNNKMYNFEDPIKYSKKRNRLPRLLLLHTENCKFVNNFFNNAIDSSAQNRIAELPYNIQNKPNSNWWSDNFQQWYFRYFISKLSSVKLNISPDSTRKSLPDLSDRSETYIIPKIWHCLTQSAISKNLNEIEDNELYNVLQASNYELIFGRLEKHINFEYLLIAPQESNSEIMYKNISNHADAIWRKILNFGISFNEIVVANKDNPKIKMYSDTSGYINGKDLIPELEHDLLKLRINEYSKPINTSNGIFIIKIIDIIGSDNYKEYTKTIELGPGRIMKYGFSKIK
ncbi:peptidylprolyl isomerase [bacterium]|nr:peptidylprolyl isomerase [bacterium]